MKVVHVSTASRWWVSILAEIGSKDRELNSNDTSLLMKLAIRMAEYYTLPENRHLQGGLSSCTRTLKCNDLRLNCIEKEKTGAPCRVNKQGWVFDDEQQYKHGNY